MDRRAFLKLAAYTGMASSLPGLRLFADGSIAPDAGFEGPYLVTVHAGGGWDPTMLCDPKGRANELEAEPVNNYFIADILQYGNIQAAPIAGNAAFFEKYYDRLLVVNGIDCATNGHEQGTRHTWSGALGEGHPSLAALAAAGLAPTAPLAYISNGGYDITNGIISNSRLESADALNKIVYPDYLNANNPSTIAHTPETIDRIDAAWQARFQRQYNKQKLLKSRQAMDRMLQARSGKNILKRLTDALPSMDESNNELKRQAQIAVAGFKSGLTASANLRTRGFDTHSDHDMRQGNSMQRLLEGVDFLMEEIERQGLTDKVIVMIGSDFARTPWYNDGNGKDHWSITSMMLMGPGITGNRVVGGTTHYQLPLTVNKSTLDLASEEVTADTIRIEPGHIHRNVRDLLGIGSSPDTINYALDVEELSLLS